MSGESCQVLERETLRFRTERVERPSWTKNERGAGKGRRFFWRLKEERSPRGEKAQESRMAPTQINPLGGRKGNGS